MTAALDWQSADVNDVGQRGFNWPSADDSERGVDRSASSSYRRRLRALALVLSLAAAPTAARAQASGFSGTVTYTGALGPVSSQRPLCLCLFADPQLATGLGCLIFRANARAYQLDRLSGEAYYAVAFLDLHLNEQLDPDEPFEIYAGRWARPGDPIVPADNPTDIDFTFGDGNLPDAATPTPTVLPSLTPTETPPSTPSAVAGDCDGNGVVGVDELVRAVGIALETLELSTCSAADLDGDGSVRIDELVSALNAALNATAEGVSAARAPLP